MTPKLYRIKKKFAEANNLPLIFVANKIDESKIAYKLKGQCFHQVRGHFKKCFMCGSSLKKGVAPHLGVCESCGDHFGGWMKFGGYSLKNIERLKNIINTTQVDKWILKKVIKDEVRLSMKTPAIKKETPPVKKAVLINNYIICSFEYDKYIAERIKELEGVLYQKRNRSWRLHLTTNNINSLSILGFELCKDIKYIQANKTSLRLDKIDYKALQPKEYKGLLRQPFPFQSIGTQFIDLKSGNGIIADDMGLGKSMQSISYLNLYPKEIPVVIVCPASLKYNWVDEINKTLPNKKVQVLEGKTKVELWGEIIIVNYDILRNTYSTVVDQDTGKKKKVEQLNSGWVDELIAYKPKIVITDECHKYKNRDSNQTKAVIKLASKVKKVIQLSATPIENGPQEFFPALHICDPQNFSSYWDFVKRYCGARKGRFGWELTRPTNIEELHHRLDGVYMIRRLKTEVLTELPDKTYNFVHIDIDNWKKYEKAEKDLLVYLSDFLDEQKVKVKSDLIKETNKILKSIDIGEIDFSTSIEKQFKEYKKNKLYKASIAEHFVHFETLKQIVAEGKLKGAIEWITDFLESGNKLVLFAEHTKIIDTIVKHFGPIALKIDGSIPTGIARKKITDRFQEDPKIKLIVGNKAMQEGLTLTAAWDVAHLEYPWTPTGLAQRTDRCHRIGQKNAVGVHYLMAPNTIDEKIAKGLDEKLKIISTIMDGKTPDSQPLMADLMEDYVKKLEKN